jgi:hypothetical protein
VSEEEKNVFVKCMKLVKASYVYAAGVTTFVVAQIFFLWV